MEYHQHLLQMLVILLIVLEITKSPEMEKQKNGHYFTIRQRGFTITIFFPSATRRRFFFNSNSSIIQKISIPLS